MEVASAIDGGSAPIDSANNPGANDAPPAIDMASANDASDVSLDIAKDGGMDQTTTGSSDGPVFGPDVVAATDVPIQTPEVGGACTIATDCPGPCQTCSSGHVCVAVVGQDDPSGHCAGTCDASGTCKSKKGQSCQTVAGGCASGTTCAPDGICCDTTCTGSCQACDIPGFLGTCTPVASGNPHGNRSSCGTDATCAGTCAGKADGTCSYPTKNCGAGPSCSGTDKAISQSTCAGGACQTPTAQPCQGGFACAGGACKTTCTTSADCQAGNYCDGSVCVAKKANGQPCTSASASTCSSGICGGNGTCCYADCGLCGTCSPSGTTCYWKATGTFCGTDVVCNSSHDCVACNQDAACVPSSNECKVGTIFCGSGAPVCSQLQNTTEGTDCNAGASFCHAGVCTAKGGTGATCMANFWCTSGQCVSDSCL
jgi:hypothetical protein